MNTLNILNRILEFTFPQFIWSIKTSRKVIYLTFDDGPVPFYTDFVLNQLQYYNAKATFFVVGHNVVKHPDIFSKIKKSKHKIGNHTFNHLNGWRVSSDLYLDNFIQCETHIEERINSKLFRPPYGRIKTAQSREILKTHKIIMWSVLTRDYDAEFDKDKCLKAAIDQTSNGSIVLFHDSEKAWKNLEYVLPRYLSYFSERGYCFETL
jgi:peptidoglycan/xylan/chitin deacetylase (PgdA/CDA1 family)